MIGYVIRRLLYGVLILIGVNLFTFILFFAVNTPDDMARLAIGGQRISQDAVEKWKVEHGYDKPLFYNAEAQGAGRLTDTVFYQRSVPLLAMEFGASDGGRDIGREIRTRMGPSLALAVPTFLLGLFVSIAFSLMLVYFRATRLDFWGVVLCVILLSISSLFYIIAGQWLVRQDLAAGAFLGLFRRAGHGQVPGAAGAGGDHLAAGAGGALLPHAVPRGNRQDYVRTARAKGLAERAVLFRHVLRNAMLPILTSTVAALPPVAESFFGIPGLGSYTIDAINAQDFSIVRAMVFLGASLYIVGLILADISTRWPTPRAFRVAAMPKIVLLWTDIALWLMALGCWPTPGTCAAVRRCAGACRARHAGHVFGRDPGGLRHRRAARFRPLPAAAATGAGRAGRRRARLRARRALGAGRAAGRQRVDESRENLFHAAGGAPVHQGNHAGGRQAGARFPAAARRGQAPGRSGPRPSRRRAQAPRPGAGGRPGGRAGRHVPAGGLPGAPARRRRGRRRRGPGGAANCRGAP